MEEVGRRIDGGDFSRRNLEVIIPWKWGINSETSTFAEWVLKPISCNTDDQIGSALQTAVSSIEANDPRKAIRALIQLKGVKLKMATAILRATFPHLFNTLDWRALESMGLQDLEDDSSVNFYLAYNEASRNKAAQYGVSLPDFDRSNWWWSWERSRRSRCRRRRRAVAASLHLCAQGVPDIEIA